MKAGITVRQAMEAASNFSKAMADVTKTMEPSVPDPLSEVTNRYLEKEEFVYSKVWPSLTKPLWTGEADTRAFNKIVAKPSIRESDQDQRSEARRWLA